MNGESLWVDCLLGVLVTGIVSSWAGVSTGTGKGDTMTRRGGATGGRVGEH